MSLSEWVASQAPLTVTEIAGMFGIGRSCLYKIMAGKSRPRRETATRIVDVTKGAVTVTDIYAVTQA